MKNVAISSFSRHYALVTLFSINDFMIGSQECVLLNTSSRSLTSIYDQTFVIKGESMYLTDLIRKKLTPEFYR